MQHFMSTYIRMLWDILNSTAEGQDLASWHFAGARVNTAISFYIIMTQQGMQLALAASIASSQATVRNEWMLLYIHVVNIQ